MALGSVEAAQQLVLVSSQLSITPDFITIDGGEGGTGAAYASVQNHTGLPIDKAVVCLDLALREHGLRHRVQLLAAGRVSSGYDLFRLLCLGADGCFFTRAPLVAMGCVQARLCHTGKCPVGIATNGTWRRGAISPDVQGTQLANYYRLVMNECEALLKSAGLADQSNLTSEFLVMPPSDL